MNGVSATHQGLRGFDSHHLELIQALRHIEPNPVGKCCLESAEGVRDLLS